jgi:hypothetical protein
LDRRNHRCPLRRGQRGERIESLAQVPPALDDRLERLADQRLVVQGDGRGLAGSRAADHVPEDLVQPAPEMTDHGPALERTPRLQERLLHDVLGPLRPEPAARDAQELGPVSLDDLRERVRVAAGNPRRQPVIRLARGGRAQ